MSDKADKSAAILHVVGALADQLKPFAAQDQGRALAVVACLLGVEEDVVRRVAAARASTAALLNRGHLYEPSTDDRRRGE